MIDENHRIYLLLHFACTGSKLNPWLDRWLAEKNMMTFHIACVKNCRRGFKGFKLWYIMISKKNETYRCSMCDLIISNITFVSDTVSREIKHRDISFDRKEKYTFPLKWYNQPKCLYMVYTRIIRYEGR
jgi:hypothetical protein